MQNAQNTDSPTSVNSEVQGSTNNSNNQTKVVNAKEVTRKITLEDVIHQTLLTAARQGGLELAKFMLPEVIADAEEKVARREAKAIIEKAKKYAAGVAAEKKFRAYHLLNELGIKMPVEIDPAKKSLGKRASRKATAAKSVAAQSEAGNSENTNSESGVAGEDKQ